jgi:hypothetical protein
MSANQKESTKKEFIVGNVISESFKLVSGLKAPIF